MSIILEKNGKIFPLWILKNFKEFTLPKIVINDNNNQYDDNMNNDLTIYQKFIGEYFSKNYTKNILLYHGVGSGKTRTVINIYNILYNYTNEWNVFLIIPASLEKDPWLKELKLWLEKDKYQKRFDNINFIHYDTSNGEKEFINKIKNINNKNKTLFIIEEVHKFINRIYNSRIKKINKIYDYITNNCENTDNKIILLSATPIINNPYEYALLFNLLRKDIFPNSETVFNQFFVNDNNFTITVNTKNKNIFQRRILGIVSYYIGYNPEKFAKKNIFNISLKMTKYQENIYNIFVKKELNSKGRNPIMTRHVCNFVFPFINKNINGEGRPILMSFQDLNDDIEDFDNINVEPKNKKYFNDIKEYIKELYNYFKKIKNNDTIYNIENDINQYKNKYKCNFDDFINSSDTKSILFNELYKSSPKFTRAIFTIENTQGTVMVYSNFVNVEGLEIFKMYLNMLNYTNDREYKNYCEFHSDINKDLREKNRNIFNNKNNINGKNFKIILVAPSGSEGITLSNVRQIHILEPYWNEVRIEQIIGRAVRFCQHKDLPPKDRVVDIFRYKMTKNNDDEITIEEKIYDKSIKKYNLLVEFNDMVKESAVDCNLFKNHNMINKTYNCFGFNEKILFDSNIIPIYNKSINEDIKTNNMFLYKTKKIKVIKIKAVIEFKKNVLSNINEYWFNKDTGIIYDLNTEFPIGKIMKTTDDKYEKYNYDTYMIKNIIDIPTI